MHSCGQCGKPFRTQVNSLGLCIDCFERLQMIKNREDLSNMMNLNLAAEQMDAIAPWGPATPRYDVRAFSESIRRQAVMNQIKIQNSQIGAINTGTIESFNQSIEFLGALNKDLAYELSSFVKQVLASNLPENKKKEAVDSVSFVADQFGKPESQRNRTVLAATVVGVTTAVSAASDLATVWETIKGFF